MATEVPLVRVLVACEQIIIESASKRYSLHRLIHRIYRLPGEPFPCSREQFALYALLSNGRGKHFFSVALCLHEAGEEVTIKESPAKEIDLGQDPLVVHGLPITKKRLAFQKPGQYSLVLLCDSQPIADYAIEVE